MGCSESKALPVDEPSNKPPEKISEAQKEPKNNEPETVNDLTEELNDASNDSENKPDVEKSEIDQKEVRGFLTLRNHLNCLNCGQEKTDNLECRSE